MSETDSSIVGYVDYKVNNNVIRISLLKTDILHVHEKIIPELKTHLVREIKKDSVIFDPIIADSKLNFVIDGTHRVAALKKLNINLIPAIDVNYLDESILVKRWFRVTRNKSLSDIANIIKGRIINIKYKDFLDILNSEQADIGFYYKGKALLYEKTLTPLQISDLLERFSTHAEFVTEYEAIYKKGLIIGYRYISKSEIINIVSNNKRFTYKFTRHIIPLRILSINMPLSLLNYDKIEKALNYLERINLRYLGKKINIDNRIYEEEVYIGEIG